ncbi:MAG: PEP-CTERM sorting domain-containing protein [Phycisphaerae bacterium]|nr:PEP-CTERM sorting domain-containing protein [Phycisphaerae bacterium]
MKKLIKICLPMVLAGIAIVLTAGTTNAGVIYSNDFESVVGSEWSNASTDITPADGRRFLGQFANDDFVTLSLDNLPSHEFITVSFDLFVIQSWDGTSPDWGPDIWQLSVNNGPVLMRTTFSNTGEDGHLQSYPGSYSGSEEYPAYTGASEINTLGYEFYGDSAYSLSFTFKHSDSSLALNFAGFGLQDISDESWGMDNMTVAVAEFNIPEPATIGILSLSVLGLIRKRK